MQVTYLKLIKPFQRFVVLTRFSNWDKRYWVTEHKFMAGDQLCAVLQVRGVFEHGKIIIQIRDVLALAGEDVKVPDKPVNVEYWKKLVDANKGASKDFDQSHNRER